MIAQASSHGCHDSFPSIDLQVRAAVVDALRSMPYAALRNLKCSVLEGTAEITGTVPTFYLKQLAQAVVLQLGGVRTVRNLVEVRG
jgi:osmotically-inducible protein OsmY